MQFYLVASSSCLLILLLVLSCSYIVEKKQFVGIWLLSLAFSLAGFIFKAFEIRFNNSLFFSAGNQIALLVSCLLLLWGAYLFAGKKIPGLMLAIFAAGFILSLAAVLPGMEFAAAEYIAGAVYSLLIINTGIVFCRLWTDYLFERYITGAAFILWGAFRMFMMLTGQKDGAELWQNLASALLGLMSILGMLLTYFRKVRRDLNVSEKSLKDNVEYLRTLIDNMNEVFFTYDELGIFSFANKKCFEVLGYQPEELIGKRVLDFTVDKSYVKLVRVQNKLYRGEAASCEALAVHKDGSLRSFRFNASPIMSEGGVKGGIVLGQDITGSKDIEHHLEYLSLHDALTGLYNRAYFEQEMHRFQHRKESLPGIVVCDVDGLKLINDILGHDSGDLLLTIAADVIEKSFGSIGTVMRIGGDEFAVLLNTNKRDMVDDSIRQLNEAADAYNAFSPEIYLSLSVGYVINSNGSKDPVELYKEADRRMYREKLYHNQSARSSVLQALMKTLDTKDFFSDGHVERLQGLVSGMMDQMGLSMQDKDDLKLLVKFHDIGKVGVPDSILFKPGPLTEEETAEVQRHSEIGYRIAQSAPDLIRIADWILKHHEWWNGGGYPLGLAGRDIPLQSRILAIIDAYDVMTSNRPYGKAMTVEQALNELERCSGTQFDPELVNQFMKSIKGTIHG